MIRYWKTKTHAWPARRQTDGYLPILRASPLFDQYQIKLLCDRRRCAWSTWLRSLTESELFKEKERMSQLSRWRVTYGIQILQLSHNRLTTLPIDLPLEYRLRELHLASNDLTEIPKDISKLKQVVLFDLSDNFLSMLPETLIKMSSLKELNLTDNMILQWPTNFVKLQDKVNVRYTACLKEHPPFIFWTIRSADFRFFWKNVSSC